jgi:hypothetical protein
VQQENDALINKYAEAPSSLYAAAICGRNKKTSKKMFEENEGIVEL